MLPSLGEEQKNELETILSKEIVNIRYIESDISRGMLVSRIRTALHPLTPSLIREKATHRAAQNERQLALTLVLTIKSPADYDALVAILPIVKGEIDNAFAQLKTVHFARVVFLDDNTKVAVITEFDGDFDLYVRDFAQAVGLVFDTLFAHTVEAPPLPVEDPQNQQAFIDFVKKYDLPIAYFYSAYPDLTVLNILDLEELNRDRESQSR